MSWKNLALPSSYQSLLSSAPDVQTPSTREEVIDLIFGKGIDTATCSYDIPGLGFVPEAEITRVANGVAINYHDPLMRRRDPDCMVIGDSLPTDKPTFAETFGKPFDDVQARTLQWLSKQDLIVTAFVMGRAPEGGTAYGGILIAPRNAAFFATALADLQGIVPLNALPQNFKLSAAILLAPPFRHTDFSGRQVVVHKRSELHEIYSYNLYPGPSAKKGVYGALLAIGERERWLTLHASTVQIVTPYGNKFVIMHEGASGAGKSEMLEQPHRDDDGRLTVATNTVTDDRVHASLGRMSILHPLTDDMALAHPAWQIDNRLVVDDAENAWFIRVDHITEYGTDPHLEKATIHAAEPLVFLNVRAAPGHPCLLWEHTEDAPGKRCPNPRVILPRRMVHHVLNTPSVVNVRNFGLRAPLCTRDNPTYGIAGFLHVLPPALGWLWRLVAPRGHNNPSVTGAQIGMQSEGVGSYWPFATGRKIDHANLLLEQIERTTSVAYTLMPNQNVGAWKVRFMPQWLCREYLARRGNMVFDADEIVAARCPLLGSTPKSLSIDDFELPHELLRVNEQVEVGNDGYDDGAKELSQFFKKELAVFNGSDLSLSGRRIIQCVFDNGTVSDFSGLL